RRILRLVAIEKRRFGKCLDNSPQTPPGRRLRLVARETTLPAIAYYLGGEPLYILGNSKIELIIEKTLPAGKYGRYKKLKLNKHPKIGQYGKMRRPPNLSDEQHPDQMSDQHQSRRRGQNFSPVLEVCL